MAETYKLRPRFVEALRYDKNDPGPAYEFLGMPADCEELSRQNAEDCERRHVWLTGYGFAEPAAPAILRWRGDRRGFALLLKDDGREHAVEDGMWLVHGSGGWSAMGHAEFIGRYEPAAAQPAVSPAPDIRKGILLESILHRLELAVYRMDRKTRSDESKWNTAELRKEIERARDYFTDYWTVDASDSCEVEKLIYGNEYGN